MINPNTAASCQTSASSYYNQTEQYVSVRSANKVLIEFEERGAESGKDWKLWKFQFLSPCPYKAFWIIILVTDPDLLGTFENVQGFLYN